MAPTILPNPVVGTVNTTDTINTGRVTINLNDSALLNGLVTLNNLTAALPWDNLQTATFPANIAAVIAGTYTGPGGGGGGGGGAVPWTSITGTPTTLAGYGITDGASLALANIFTAEQTVQTMGEQLRLGWDVSHYGSFTADAGGNITHRATNSIVLSPTGNVITNPTGKGIFPATPYDINIGNITLKYKSLSVGDLFAETLVAQNTIATIGGRILVGPTDTLVYNVLATDGAIFTKRNQFAVGDILYLEVVGSIEFMTVTFGPTGSGPYQYNVTRNVQGTTAKAWYAGDALFNTRQTGAGWIDLYSVAGMSKNGTSYNAAGPTIAFNVRNSNTFNDWSAYAAIGNLNGLYNYTADTYGVGLGVFNINNQTLPYLTMEATNGLTVWNSDGATPTPHYVKRMVLKPDGTFSLNDKLGNPVVLFHTSGFNFIQNPMYLGTGGGFYQGTGSFGTPVTGVKFWNNAGIGSVAGFNGGVQQWGVDTLGNFTWGAPGTGGRLNANGIQVLDASAASSQINWYTSLASPSNPTGTIGTFTDGANNTAFSLLARQADHLSGLVFNIPSAGGTGTLATVYLDNATAWSLDSNGVHTGAIGTNPGWKLKGYTTTAPAATGYVNVTINGVNYKLLAST